MNDDEKKLEDSEAVAARSECILASIRFDIFRQTDRLFAVLLILEWFAGIIVAVLISPLAWAGEKSWVHVHVWACSTSAALS